MKKVSEVRKMEFERIIGSCDVILWTLYTLNF